LCIHQDYALRLLKRGVICLPLRPAGKHLDIIAMGYDPVHLETMRKDLKELAFTGITFHLAQKPPDEETVAGWFSRSEANIGILGGVNNLVILDFDNRERFETWCLKHDKVAKSTPVAKTPGGYHVYVRPEVKVLSSSLHTGLRRAGHVKSLGGYVVASPSVLASGARYEWLPGQSLEDIEPVTCANLAGLSIRPVSPLKHAYDRLLGRGFFKEQ
jgi:hypothetical protein